MTWAPILLAERSANLRWLVLTELLGRPAGDAEVLELAALRETDPLVIELLAFQDQNGAWRPHGGGGEAWQWIGSTAQALSRLGYLGFGPAFAPIRRAAEYLFSLQTPDGSWPLPRSKAEREFREPYEMVPLQAGIPLSALAMAGFGADRRAERAYDWLLAQRLEDGAWPSGIKSGQKVFPAGYRRLAHSRFGCRTNTTFAALALAHHPQRRSSDPARQALNHLLAHDSLPAHTLGIQVARYSGLESSGGYFTHFARYDIALILDMCWRIGASLEDGRVAERVAFVKKLQGPYGLWQHPTHPEASRWLTFDLLRSLSRLERHTDWISLQPRTPFQPYPKEPRRY